MVAHSAVKAGRPTAVVDLDLGQPWKGDAELTLFDSPWDEPASLLPVDEIIAGYFCEVGTTFAGGSLLTDNSRAI